MSVNFGKNTFLAGSQLNDSTSHIQDPSNSTFEVKSICLSALFSSYNIDGKDVALIKVDIEGGEEFILDDLFNLKGIPLLISFHYSWWKNKNLDRFTGLTVAHKSQIVQNPFTSIVFV